MRSDTSRPETTSPLNARARAALADGDYRAARNLARQVASDGSAPEQARREAQSIVEATGPDRGAIITGLIIVGVLVALFAFVLTR